jgi:hypothetical protein
MFVSFVQYNASESEAKMPTVKAALMLCTYFSAKEDPLMTIGDALASFLDKQDAVTKDVGLLTIRSCRKKYRPGARPWRDFHWQWKDVISRTRRAAVLVL